MRTASGQQQEILPVYHFSLHKVERYPKSSLTVKNLGGGGLCSYSSGCTVARLACRAKHSRSVAKISTGGSEGGRKTEGVTCEAIEDLGEASNTLFAYCLV